MTTLRRLRRSPLEFFQGLPDRYGPLTRMRLGPFRLFAVADPTLVTRVLVEDADGYRKGMALERARFVLGNGLLTSDGDLHRRQLRMIGPALAPRRIASYEAAMVEAAATLSDEWRDGECVDISAEMGRLTLRVVVASLFGMRLAPDDAGLVQRDLTAVMEHFDWLVTHPLGTRRLLVPSPRARRLVAARNALRDVVDRVIAARSAALGGDDLLAHLIAARDEAGGMDVELMRDEVLTLMLAGHETTANWLTFTWLALAAHPDVRNRLQAELAERLGDRPITFADRDRLPFTVAVLQETLRLYPPAWGIGRRTRSARSLGGQTLPAGALVSLCPFVLHRDPSLWDAPERFDPERWLDGRAADVPRGAFFPFSDGPRRCIGEHFARHEALVILATLAPHWTLERIDASPIGLNPSVTLRPRGSLTMRLHRRT